MFNVSTAFKKKLYRDERDYINALQFTLADGTVLNVTHEHIMENGVNLDDAVGEDSKFNPLGATVCNSLEVTLYNNDEIYSDYIFENAKCIYTVGLNVVDNNIERLENLQKGAFTVDEATYDDYTITLKMLDFMEQFDRPYTSTLVYPATLGEIVRGACADCLGNTSDLVTQTFPHYDYIVQEKPSSEDTTYRDVLSYCATIAGCFARCNYQGKLELKWFDTSVLEDTSNEFDGGVFDSANPYATGDNVEGGSFNPWNTGDTAVSDEFTTVIPYHYITDLTSQTLGVDDIVITGVSIEIKLDSTESETEMVTYSVGTSDFMIQIKDNPFITEDTVEDVLDWLSTQLIGLTFRQCNVTHPNDPTIEAGDVGILWDKKGVQHNVLITRVTFCPTAYQTVICGAESISKNQATRISEATKSFVEGKKRLRKELEKQKSDYEDAMDDLADAIENANGLYYTEEVQEDQSVKYFLHEKPLLSDSNIRIEFSTAGITVTPDRGAHWYGLTVNGNFIANIMNTIGLNFDWGTGGTLKLGGANNGNGVLRILDANDNQIGFINNTGAYLSGDITMKSTNGQANFTTFPYKIRYIPGSQGDIFINGTGFGFQVQNSINSGYVRFIIGNSNPSSTINAVSEEIDTTWIYTKVIMRTYLNTHLGYGISFNPYPNDFSSITGIRIIPFDADTNIPVDLEKVIIANNTIQIVGREQGAYILIDGIGASEFPRSKIIINDESSGLAHFEISSEVENTGNADVRLKKDNIRLRTAGNISNIDINLYTTTSNVYNALHPGFIQVLCGMCEINIGGGKSEYRDFLLTNGDNSGSDTLRELSGTYNYLSWNGNNLAYESASSKRYKHDIEELKDKSLDPHKLLDLQIKQFIFNEDAPLQYPDMRDRLIPGFIAEEVAEIYPSATVYNVETKQIENWDERRIIPGMLALIQEQHKKIEEQEDKIKSLEKRLEKLESFIETYMDDGR